MRLLDETTASDFLRETGRIHPYERIVVRELPGGVSNVVLYVERPDVPGGDFVLKQARGQLRVEQPWYCSVERIWREVETLRVCQAVLSGEPEALAPGVQAGAESFVAVTPHVLWEDRENYAFAMTAAPPHRVWKADLLDGVADERIAWACGNLLGRLHAGTWQGAGVAASLADTTFFEDLRVDPYYRHVAQVHPELEFAIERLIDSLAANRLSLVHGDFSPKNLLVYEGGIMLVDCEVGHFGDPAFDLGFFLTHLSLKAILKAPRHAPYLGLASTFWIAYFDRLKDVATQEQLNDLARRAMQNLGGCVLARIDGKSPVEYLGEPRRKSAARRFGTDIFGRVFASWHEARVNIRQICEEM